MPVLHLRMTMPAEVFRAVNLAEWNPAGILAGNRRLPGPSLFCWNSLLERYLPNRKAATRVGDAPSSDLCTP